MQESIHRLRHWLTKRNQLFSLRLTGDYEDRHILDMETEVLPLVEPAKELINLVVRNDKKVM